MAGDRCGSCEAFKMGGCGSNSQYRKFHDRLGYCAWTLIKNKMMTVYENNVPCGKFVPRVSIMVVAIGR